MRKRILSIVLTLCMVLTLVPQVVFAEGEEGSITTAKDITLGDAALHDADTEGAKWDYVYFGTYNNSPIKWRVLSTKGNSTTVGTSEDTATYKTADGEAYTGNALFMLSENTLGSNTAFGYNNKYQGSALQTAMKGIFSSDSKELKYVLKTTKTDSSETIGYINPYNNNQITWGGSGLSEDTLFALSAREAEQYLGSGEKYANRISGNAAWWWLRSPRSAYADNAGVVNFFGSVDYNLVDHYYDGVRPALNLNLSSVLFTSAAVGGKSSHAAAGGVTGIFENKNYADITGSDGYKLTLLDESRANFTAELKSISGNTATVSYSGATPGTNEYISVIIKNGDTVKYYGRIAAASTASGEVNITLPSDFSTANGDVLCVFNEQYNGDYNTDYASKLIDVTNKDITLGYAALHEADTTNAKWDYVYFGTYNNSPIKWRVLSTEGNKTTVGTGEDTATYKTAGGTAYTGKALFMLSENTLFDTWFYGTTYDNAWLTSNLRNKMQNDIFSNDSAELKYVLKTTKTDSSETIGYINPYNNNQYSIIWGGSGLSEDTLFALSAREVEQYLGSGEKYANRISGNAALWWLRSPDSADTFSAGVVTHDGVVDSNIVDNDRAGVRPALNLNLSSVLFTSAAVGGKSSNAAVGGVTGIFENKNYADITGNDGYKLTLLDESRSDFSAYLKSVSGNTATVSYSGAKTGTNEYISVIIKNGDTVKYYGRVATASTASGTVDITLPSDFSTVNGDVLCVFNEQYNGDKNTDYASKLIDVLFDYTVNFDANGGDGTMASQTMTYGTTANLSANTFTRNGYTFNGWNTKADGTGTEYSDGQSVTNLVSDASTKSVTLYAQWKIINYNISYTLNDGTATNPTAYTVESEDITLTNPTKSGYTFTGWSGTELTGENNMTVIIPKGSTGNRNYVTHYSVKSGYTVSFDVNGGDALADKTGVKWTDKILDVVPTPTRTGYTFKGWKHNDTDITADTAYKDLVADDTVTDITLTAQWEENSNYTVTFDTAGGTSENPKTNVKWTDKVLEGITNPTRDGYEFTGWKCKNVTVTADTTYAELAVSDTVMSVLLTAQWKDIAAPTGEITIGTNSWKAFLNNITFGLFFKDTQKVEITATDNSGEDVTIEYLLSNKELTADDLAKATFTAYNGKFNIEPNNEYVIYAKLTDTTGNVTYINSNGIVLDNVAPVISGIKDGKTYCSAQTVTVTEKYVDTVTVNGNPVTPDTNGQFTLSPAEGEQKIVVTDKAGNQTEMTVTVNDGHTGGTADCTHKALCTVCGEEYGTVNSENHDFTAQVKSADTLKSAATCQDKAMYYYTCSRCGEIEKNDTHTFEGELDSSKHTQTLGDWQNNDDGHWKTYICCPTVKAAEGSHTYEWQSENGQYWQKCTVCEHETAKKDIPEITINGADKVCVNQDYHFTVDFSEDNLTDIAYGYLVVDDSGILGGRHPLDLKYTDGVYCADISSGKYGKGTTLTVTAYAKTSDGYTVSVDKNITILSDHTGGTADCTLKAKCEVCGEEYGNVNADNHTDEKEWTTKNETQHEQIWKCCGATVIALENHEWENGICKECGYECSHNDNDGDHKCDICGNTLSEHTGGTATCTHKAVCDICGEEYGEVDDDNHAELKHIEAKEPTTETEGNIEYWHCEDCDRYFSYENSKNEISLADTVIAKLPKTDDDKVPSTDSGNGETQTEVPTTDNKVPQTKTEVSTTGNAKTENNTKVPKTGDRTNTALWFAVLFISGGALISVTAYDKKKKRFVK